MAGLAGGLDPSLRTGQIVIDERSSWVGADGGGADFKFGADFRCGRIHTARRMICSPAEKAALFRQTGALAVEMENEIVREASDRWGVPFTGIRAICDAACDMLDPAVLSFVDPFGRPRPAALARGLVRRPGLIPQLVRLAADTRTATDWLGKGVRRLLDGNGL